MTQKIGYSINIDGDHVIEILTESVSDQYLQPLRDKKVSYAFAGKDKIDIKLALEQLYSLFGITKLMLESGGHRNGSLLAAGFVGKISLLILPLADGTSCKPTTFEAGDVLRKKNAYELKIKT